MKVLRPLFIIMALMLIVGMACSFGSGTDQPAEAPTQAQQEPATEAPTDEPAPAEPTATEAPAEPTATEAPTALDFYKEEFEGDLSNYSYFEFNGKDDDAEPKNEDGFLVFDLQKENLWVYVTYDAFSYENVRVDLKADNRGKNNNNVSLICRYSDEGWYEFNIANNGLYSILAYVEQDRRYYTIYNGGSTLIKQGKDENEYTFICKDDELTGGINGVEVKTIKDTKYKLRDGKVGFSVSSFDVLPILVNVDYFQISEP